MQRDAAHGLQQHLGRTAAADIHKDIPCPQVLPGKVGGYGVGVRGGCQRLQKAAGGIGGMLQIIRFSLLFRRAGGAAVSGDLCTGKRLARQGGQQ